MEHVRNVWGLPEMRKNRENTECPLCQRWSPPADWYHEFIPDEQQEAEVSAVC